jgi:hypothetical protein
VSGALGTIGTSCLDELDCSPMAPACVESGGDSVCAPSCDAGHCPPDFQCTSLAQGAARCLRSGLPLGSECNRNAECSSAMCDDRRCARACSPSLPCPADFACKAGNEDGATRCKPQVSGDGNGGCNVLAGRESRLATLALAPLLGLCLRRLARRRATR